MQIALNFACERQELENVLSSGLFTKSQNLAKLLSYVCNQYFEGHADDLKEYQIAVEALGRPPDFDPALSPIVRVEMHRLRGKLKKYYESDGVDHPIFIKLEAGSYSPRFERRESSIHIDASGAVSPDDESTASGEAHDAPQTAAHEQDAAATEAAPSLRAISAHVLRHKTVAGALIGIAVALLVGGSATWWRFRSAQRQNLDGSNGRAERLGPIAPASSDTAVRILCGLAKGTYMDRSGNRWGPDQYFKGGVGGNQAQQSIARTLDPTLFQTFRRGDFSYDIPLQPGVYELHLYFSETFFGPGTIDLETGEGDRVFDVIMNGKPLLTDFDIIADTGSNKTADVRVFRDVVPAADGYLHLQFRRKAGDPTINAIEIIPGIPGRLRSIRLVAQDNSFTDKDGNVWLPDDYFSGGRHALHKGPVTETADPGLYAGERFGNFTYQIPVDDGRYSLTLYFAETFFGPDSPGKGVGGIGSRTFDVICNDEPLLREFDIFKKAGGKNIAVSATFRGLRPNAHGKLDLEFQPIKNYATVSAIEVHQEP